MSAQAGEHFAAQAAELGLTLPPILDGNPVALVDPSRRWSIHLTDSLDHQGLPNELRGATRDQMRAVGDYLLQAFDVTYPNVDPVNAELTRSRWDTNPAASFFDAFTPTQKKLKTGHLRTFMAEVVMPDELTDEIQADLLHRVAGYKRHVTEHMAYLVTTAELFSGKSIGRLGSVSCIAVTGHGSATDTAPFSRVMRPALFVSKIITTRQAEALAALRESRATAREVESRAVRHPYSGGLMH